MLQPIRPWPLAYLLCQWRFLSITHRLLADAKPPHTPAPQRNDEIKFQIPTKLAQMEAKRAQGPLADAPRFYGNRVKEFVPTPLLRPIGLRFPPQAGENTGKDMRSRLQRRVDRFDYERHSKRREELKFNISKPYFRDITNLDFHKGKTFIAPPRPFRADHSLYFPNLHGRTLDAKSAIIDTTPVLTGRTSVVAVFSGLWAENQVATFTSKEQNPALHDVFKEGAQIVRVNVEENALKWWILRILAGSLRRKLGTDPKVWQRYFVVRGGVSDEIRESIALLNSKVGYVYVVDKECRIRWAGCGNSEEGEREVLVAAVRRVLRESDGPGTKMEAS